MLIRRATSLLIVLLTAVPLFAGGPVHPVAAPLPGPVPYVGRSSVAFNDDGGVAVWTTGSRSIWGVRLDTAGRPIGSARHIWTYPEQFGAFVSCSVTSIDGTFVLWWKSGYPYTTRTARLTADLSLADTKTLETPALPRASNGSLTLAVSAAPGEDGVVRFFDRSRELVRSATITGIASNTYPTYEAVVLDDGSFGVGILSWTGLYFTRFAPDGAAIGSPLLVDADGTATTAHRPRAFAIASDGDAVLLVWSASEPEGLASVKSAIVARDDTVSARQTLIEKRWKSVPHIAALHVDGAYAVTFSAGAGEWSSDADTDVYAVRLNGNGMVTAELAPLLVRNGREDDLRLTDSRGTPLLFFRRAGAMPELFVIEVPRSGSLARTDAAAVDARVSEGAAWQLSPAAATDGRNWLVAWVERTALGDEIRSAPLHSDGTPAAPPSIIATAPHYTPAPSVAFNGLEYVVAWIGGGSLLAKRIGRDGMPIDDTPIEISAKAAGRLSVAGTRGVSLIAWDVDSAVHAAVLHNDRVSAPAVLSAGEKEPNYVISYVRPVVSAAGGSFLVGWMRHRMHWCVGPPCQTDTIAQVRLIGRTGAPLSEVLTMPLADVYSAASAGNTHLVTSEASASAVLISASVSGASVLPLADAATAARAFAIGNEYRVVLVSPDASLVVQRISSDGAELGREAVEAITIPWTMSGSGALLSLAAAGADRAPYYGAPAVVAQVSDTSLPLPPRSRRRSVRP